MSIVNPQNAVNFFKQNFPFESGGMTEAQMYESFKSLYPNYNYPENPFQTRRDTGIPDKNSVLNGKNSEEEQGFPEKLLTANLADRWASEHDWAKRSYNNSLSGQIFQIIHGKPKYTVDMESSGWVEDVQQFFVGLASPVDIGIFLGSGGIGGLAAKSFLGKHATSLGGKILANKYASTTAYMAGTRGVNRAVNSSVAKLFSKKGALESGISLATYGAAGGTLQDAAEQRRQKAVGERESFDPWQNIWSATKHGISSGMMGAAGGFITKGVMLPKLAKAKAASDKTFANAVKKMMYGPLGQVGAEAQVFTGGQLIEMAISGHEIDMDTYWSTLFMNTGIIGGLKTGSKLITRGKSDVHEYNKMKKNLYEEVVLRDKYTGKDTKGKMLSNLKEAKAEAEKDGNTELANKLGDEVISLEKIMAAEANAAEIFKKEFDVYEKLVEKLNSKKPSDLTVEEQSLLVQGTAFLTNLEWSMYKEMRENPDAAYSMFAKKDPYNKTPDKLTTPERQRILKDVDKRLKDLEELNEIMNVTSITGSEADMRHKFADKFDVNIVKSKTKDKYNIEIEGPNNKILPVLDAFKNLNKENAEIIAKSVKGEITKVITSTTPVTPPGLKPGQKIYYKVLEDSKGEYGYELDTTTNKAREYTFTKQELQDANKIELDAGRQGYAEPPVTTTINPSNPHQSNNEAVNQIAQLLSPVLEANKAMMKHMEGMKESGEFSPSSPIKVRRLKELTEQTNKILEGHDESLRKGWTDSEKVLYNRIFSKLSKINQQGLVDKMNDIDRIAWMSFSLEKLEEGNTTTNNKYVFNVAKFLVDLKNANKDVSQMSILDMKQFFDKWVPLRNRNAESQALSFFAAYVRDNGFVTLHKGRDLRRYGKLAVNEFNEYRDNFGPEPPQVGVRQAAVQLAMANKDVGFQITGRLGAGYYIRNQEINKLFKYIDKGKITADGPNKGNKVDLSTYLKQVSDGVHKGEYYLDLTLDIVKHKKKKGLPRKVWIDKELAELIIDTVNSGKKLQGYTSEVGKMIIENDLTLNGAKGTSVAFYDLRKRGKAVNRGPNITLDDAVIESFLFGHEASSIDRVYRKQNINEIITDQKRFHEAIKSPIPELNKNISNRKFLIMPEGQAAAKDVHLKRREIFRSKYPELGISILNKFDAAGLPRNAVGYIQDNIIRIKAGKAPSWAIPHEVSHHAFDMIRGMRDLAKEGRLPADMNTRINIQSMKLLEQAEKIFIKDGKFSEEYAVSTIDKVIDRMIEKPMMSKVQGWLKRFNRFIKSIFNVKPTKQEVAWALGERILTRKGVPYQPGQGSGAKYLKMKDFASPKDYSNSVERDFNNVVEKYKMEGEEKGLMTIIAEAALIDNADMFSINLSKVPSNESIARLEKFHEAMRSLNFEEMAKRKDKISYIRLYKEAENKRIYKKDITLEKQKEMLEDIGVPDGNIWKASVEQLTKYNDYLDAMDNVKRNNIDWVTDNEIAKLQSEETAGIFKKISSELIRFGGPAHEAIGALGLKTLQDKVITHNAAMEGELGHWVRFEHEARLAVGDKSFDGTLRKRGIKDNLWTVDNKGEMFLEDLKWVDKVSKKEKKIIKQGENFFRKAISDEWWQTLDSEKTKGKNLGKYLRKEVDGVTLTPEAKVVEAHLKMTDAYADNLPKFVGMKLNEAARDKWLDTHNIEMIKDGISLTRAVTNEGKNAIGVNKGEVEKIVRDIARDIADKEAIKKYGKDYTNEQLLKTDKNDMSLLDYAQGLAWNEYHNMTTFSSAKFGSKYLKRRHMKQANYMRHEDTGKFIRMYERDYTKLTKSYVYGISRFYANLQVFPELISLDGFIYAGMKEQRAKLADLKGSSAATGQWVLEILDKTVGLGKYDSPYEVAFTNLEIGTRTLAKLGLSFPTSGLKNLLTGGTQTLYAYDVADVFKGVADYIGKDSAKMERAMRTGAPETGMRIWEGTKGEQALDKLSFKWGFMKPTEKFNRYVNVLIGFHDQKKSIERIRRYPEEHKLHKRALERFRNFYQLNEKDIQRLKDYGTVEGVKSGKFATDYKKAQMIKEMELIEQKMSTAAHINTQGSSADIFMPAWAGSRLIRPLTLYKRMAFAATANTIRSVKSSIKEGNYIRPLIGLAATYASGRAMIGTYHYVLGQEMPHENSAWWKRLKVIMWKGEILGLLSDFFTPYDHSVGDTIQPAMYNTLMNLKTAMVEVGTGRAFIGGEGQALDTFMRKNVQIYNNTRKIIQSRKSKYAHRDDFFDKLYREYEKDEHDKKGGGRFGKTKRSPYYHDLRMVFRKGTAEEFAKQYFVTVFSIANDYLRTKKYADVNTAITAAEQYSLSEIKKMNPNRGSFFKNKKDKLNEVQWMSWILSHERGEKRGQELWDELLLLEAKFTIRHKNYIDQLPYHARKLNLAKLFDQHPWDIPALEE